MGTECVCLVDLPDGAECVCFVDLPEWGLNVYVILIYQSGGECVCHVMLLIYQMRDLMCLPCWFTRVGTECVCLVDLLELELNVYVLLI